MKIITIMALKLEAAEHFQDISPVFSGVGKINATYALACSIVKQRPDIVINLGSAGGITKPAGSVVFCDNFIQRDMSVTALGFQLHQTPFEDDIILSNGLIIDNYESAICATGDSFVNNITIDSGFDVVDMEAYALAKICKIEKIPFYCAKYISDNANEKSASDWQPSLDDGAIKLRAAYDIILKSIANL